MSASGVRHLVPTASHFGSYLADTRDGVLREMHPIAADSDPSPIGTGIPSALRAPSRLTTPLVRAGYLRNGPGDTRRGGHRGAEPFVEVDWETAIELTAAELERVRAEHGNEAIYGGSYGWGSAGRFHHPQSQLHRFLNMFGGYTASVDTYSSAAMQVILRRVAGGYIAALDSSPTWQEVGEHRSLVVAFGGIAARNSQVNAGGVGDHRAVPEQRLARRAGADFVSLSPMRTDADAELDAEWVPIVPGTDVAVMLGLAHEIVSAGAHDREFLTRSTLGWEEFERYVRGTTDGVPKTAAWAAELSGIAEARIVELAAEIVGRRTVIAVAYSLQRADHGEQPVWMGLVLAAISGWFGRPGGGFAPAMGALHRLGLPINGFRAAAFSQGVRPVDRFIPVARIADALLAPGDPFDYDGTRYTYPDLRLVYWAGGNPFHHHQDLNRLVEAWQRPDTVIVHEHFANSLARHADIVFPAATFAERDDVAAGDADPYISAMVRTADPPPGVRTDFDILAAVARRLGFAERFTEGRDAQAWVCELYERTRQRARDQGVELPELDELRRVGQVRLPEPPLRIRPFAGLRLDPQAHPIHTPSGKLEISSPLVASFGYADCPGHPMWLPPTEWLGSPLAGRFPLHLVSGQPERRLHSQFDNGSYSRAGKVAGREPVLINTSDAARRGIAAGDVVRLFNDRGQCLAGAVVSDEIRPGVVRLSTGAWYDPVEPGGLDLHGNPNVLTPDRGTSSLAQGPSAHSCLVELERAAPDQPAVRVFDAMPIAAESSNADGP